MAVAHATSMSEIARVNPPAELDPEDHLSQSLPALQPAPPQTQAHLTTWPSQPSPGGPASQPAIYETGTGHKLGPVELDAVHIQALFDT